MSVRIERNGRNQRPLLAGPGCSGQHSVLPAFRNKFDKKSVDECSGNGTKGGVDGRGQVCHPFPMTREPSHQYHDEYRLSGLSTSKQLHRQGPTRDNSMNHTDRNAPNGQM
jgi:hypothetical protein